MENPKLVERRVDETTILESDITLLDLFAGMAITGMLANPHPNISHSTLPQIAYRTAGEMLKERENVMKKENK